MRTKIFAAAVFAIAFASAGHANTPVSLSSVGMMPTKISAVRAAGAEIDLDRVELSNVERRRVALLGMIMMQAKGVPIVH